MTRGEADSMCKLHSIINVTFLRERFTTCKHAHSIDLVALMCLALKILRFDPRAAEIVVFLCARTWWTRL